jgi:hypothetical protein
MNKKPQEYGGVLLGYLTPFELIKYVTLKVVTVKNVSKDKEHYYTPSRLMMMIKAIPLLLWYNFIYFFKKNRIRIRVIGEWHNHPNGFPYPSLSDLEEMFKKFEKVDKIEKNPYKKESISNGYVMVIIAGTTRKQYYWTKGKLIKAIEKYKGNLRK